MSSPINSKLHQLQAKWERYVNLTASRKTSERYSKCLEAFFACFGEKSTPQEFTRADVEDFKLIKIKEGWNPRTVNYTVQVVRAFWSYMIDLEETTWNPFSKVKRLKESEPERNSMTLTQQSDLYSSVASHGTLQDKLLVGLALSTGLRAETLIQLTTEDVDLETSALRIPAEKMKAARNHAVPLRESEALLIRDLPPGRLFEGYARTAAALAARFNRLCQRASISLRGLRTARRTFATTLLRSGVDLRTVQTLLAHKNITTTSRYLTPADEATSRAAIDRLPIANVPEVRDAVA